MCHCQALLHLSEPTVTVDQLWVLSLCLKALLKSLQSGGSEAVPEIFQAQFVKCVVTLAGLGTGFSREWLLKDLEVGVVALCGCVLNHGNWEEVSPTFLALLLADTLSDAVHT